MLSQRTSRRRERRPRRRASSRLESLRLGRRARTWNHARNASRNHKETSTRRRRSSSEERGFGPPGEGGLEVGDGEPRGGESPRGTHAGTHSTGPTRGSEIDLRAGTVHAARTGAQGTRGSGDETETATRFSIDHPRGSGTEPSRDERRTRGTAKRTRTEGTADPKGRPGNRHTDRRPEDPRSGAHRAGGGHQGE